ncbi:MAG: TonB-dependent receptor, partial [Gammaproteobacteria bacterium]|nr:TonB-dependent receptor [Gammaproteobacteria bacterium]
FTYALDNPAEGDEFTQKDGRNIYGVSAAGAFNFKSGDRTPAENTPSLEWGVELRHDDIDTLALFPSTARQRAGEVRDDDVAETSLAGHMGIVWPITGSLTATVGTRLDHYRWKVDAIEAANSGRGHESRISPKATLAWRATEVTEIYLNYGRGMHSNDVRGAELSFDPASGDPADPLDVLVPSDGFEIGMRYQPDQNLNLTMALFRLELESELVFVGDAGGTETRGRSLREGFELGGFWQLTEWLSAHGNYGWTRSRSRDEPAGFRRIPGAISSAASAGLNARWENGITASMRVRYLGRAPLIEDNSVRSDDSLMVNAGAAWRRGAFEYRVDAFNLLNSRDYDIAYFYTSRLPGEPDEGVDDVHFHPLEPRSVRFALRVLF